jgi:hypothetical protein
MVVRTLLTLLIKRELFLLITYVAFYTFIYAGFSNILPAILAYKGVSIEVIGIAYSLEKALVLLLSMIMLIFSIRQKVFYLMPFILILYGTLIAIFAMVKDPLLMAILVPLITGAYLSLRPFNRVLVNTLVGMRTLGFFVGILSSASLLVSIVSTLVYGFLLEKLGLLVSIIVLLILLLPTLVIQLSLILVVFRVSTQYTSDAEGMISLKRIKLVMLDPVLLILSLTQLIEVGISVYISVILWNLLKDFSIVGLALSIGSFMNLILSPIMGRMSDKVFKPLTFMGISLCILALSYITLSLSYIHTFLVFIALTLVGIAPSIFIPNLHIYVKSLNVSYTTYFSSLELLSSLTGVISPFIAAMIISRVGFQTFLELYAIGEFLFGLTLLIKAFSFSK